MPVESAADRAAFLDPDEFGTIATYRAQGAADVDINVIRDLPSAPVFGDPGLAGGVPSVLLRSADLPAGAAADADSIVVEGVLYAVRVIEPDGTGMTRLRLEEIEP